MYSGKKIAWVFSGNNTIATLNDRVQLISEGIDKGIIVVVDGTKKAKITSFDDYDMIASFLAEVVDILSEGN